MRKHYDNFAEVGGKLIDVNRSFLKLNEDGLFANGDLHEFRDEVRDPLVRASRSAQYVYRIMFAGGFNGGKSTLINALLDYDDLLPTQDMPYTGVITYIRKGHQPAFSVRFLNRDACFSRFEMILKKQYQVDRVPTPGNLDDIEAELSNPNAVEDIRAFRTFINNYDYITQMPVSFHQRKMFIVGGGYIGRKYYSVSSVDKESFQRDCDPRESVRYFDRIYLAMVDHTILELDSDLLNNQVEIIDSPGLNAVYEVDAAMSRQLLAEADALVIVNQEVGDRISGKVLEEKLKDLLQIKQNVDKQTSLNPDLALESLSDRVFFVWNKIDRVDRESLNEIVPTYFNLLPVENPQVRFTSARAYFDTATREKLRSSFASDGGGTIFSEVAAELKRISGDDERGGVLSLRRDLIEHGQGRAHFYKLSDVRDAFDSNLGSLMRAVKPEYQEVERKFSDPEMVRRGFIKQQLDVMYLELVGTVSEEEQVAGRFDVLRDGYLSDGELPAASKQVSGKTFRTERDDLMSAIHREIVEHTNRMFGEMGGGDGGFAGHAARVSFARAIRLYKKKVVQVAQDIVAERVVEVFQELLGYEDLVSQARRLLPINRDGVAVLRKAVRSYEDLVRHSVGGRVSEELASAQTIDQLDMGELTEEGIKLIKTLQRKFVDVFVNGHLASVVLPRLKDVIGRHLVYDLDLTREAFRDIWDELGDHVLESENLRCIDLKELAESEYGGEGMANALRLLRVGRFCTELGEARSSLSAAIAELDRIESPPRRPQRDWLSR